MSGDNPDSITLKNAKVLTVGGGSVVFEVNGGEMQVVIPAGAEFERRLGARLYTFVDITITVERAK